MHQTFYIVNTIAADDLEKKDAPVGLIQFARNIPIEIPKRRIWDIGVL